MSINEKIIFRKLDLVKKHFQNCGRHSTVKKFTNLLINEIELKKKKIKLTTLPYFIKVEPTPYCNLGCTGCIHGKEELNKEFYRNMVMSFDNFKKIIDPLSDTLFGISLSHRGEPLLNPHLVQMITYCHEKNIGTEFPTSFSVKLDNNQIEQLVISGLDHLVVSIDGITQDVYRKYRTNGNLDLVLKNVSYLIGAKKRLKSKTPFIEFKFIIFPHNYHQLTSAHKLSNDMGFDKFSVISDYSSSLANKKREETKVKNIQRKKACYWPWNSLVVYWNGIVSPCCTRHYNMGNAFENPINLIWNNYKYQELRSFFHNYDSNEWDFCINNCWIRS